MASMNEGNEQKPVLVFMSDLTLVFLEWIFIGCHWWKLYDSVSTFPASLLCSSPEVCFGELLHVELLICEGGQVDVADGWEHFT